MLYVKYNRTNSNHVYSNKDSQTAKIELDINKQEAEIIYNEITMILAKHILNNRNSIVELIKKHKIKTGTNQKDVATTISKLLYKGNKSFRDDLISNIIESSKQVEKNKNTDDNPISIVAISEGLVKISETINKNKSILQAETETTQKILANIAQIKQDNAVKLEKNKKVKNAFIVAIVVIIIIVGAIFYIRYKKRKKREQ